LSPNKKAYSAIRNFWGCQYDEWEKFCLKLVEDAWGVVSAMNAKNAPYLISEMKATARSIAKYTWKNTTPSGFQAYVEMTHLPHQQSRRGKASGVARLALSAEKREQAIELSRGGMKQKEIAQMLGVNQSTVQRWLKPSSNYA
jgi:DNA-binding NarL/FixJ family response regulator